MKRSSAALLVAVVAGLLVAGCSNPRDNGPDIGPTNPASGNNNPGGASPPPQAAATAALFQPAQGILPWPIDLYFLNSTDGTLNIQPANALIPAQSALNALDGFSTVAPIRARFASPIDPATLRADTVFVVHLLLDNATKAPISPLQGGVFEPLTFGTDFTAGLASDTGVGNTIVEIRPTRPLIPSTGTTNHGYLVILTNGIQTASGEATTPDATYQTFKDAPADCAGVPANAAPLCLLVKGQLALAAPLASADDVTLTFSFSTQSTRDTMELLANPAITTAQEINVTAVGITTSDLVPQLQGKADLYSGTLTIPYYLSRPSADRPTAPLTDFWQGNPSPLDPDSRLLTRFNPLPVATETIQIPVFVTVPNANSAAGAARPPADWKALIFQHGLTRNRMDAIAVADSYADLGFVVVSIDLPLHGIAGADAVPQNPFYQPDNERTFNLNLVNNTTLAPPADDIIDGSGTHFVQLTSLLTTRDNLRQGAVDLLTLVRSLPDLDVTGDGVGDIDPTQIHFLGHSLGAIVGGVFLGVAPGNEVATSVMMAPGGAVAQTIFDSPAFGPAIIQGLAAQGIAQGSTIFNQFIRDAQTVVDSGDPINYIESAVAARPLLLFQVVGGGTLSGGETSPPDQVVVNSATQRLIDVGNIPRITPPGAATGTGHVNFIFGSHGSIIDPGTTPESLATTVEMQTEAISFAVSGGTAIPIGNAAVVQP